MLKSLLIKGAAMVILASMVTLTSPWMTYACPGCSNALSGTVGRGFNMSILFLIAMPFLLIGSFAFGLIYLYQQSQTKSKDNNSSES